MPAFGPVLSHVAWSHIILCQCGNRSQVPITPPQKLVLNSISRHSNTHSSVSTRGIDTNDDADLDIKVPALDRLVVLKTSWKPMSEELKQFVMFTSGTSAGSAKVMSTHYTLSISDFSLTEHVQLAYTVKRCSMYSRLHDLDGSIVSNIRCIVGR